MLPSTLVRILDRLDVAPTQHLLIGRLIPQLERQRVHWSRILAIIITLEDLRTETPLLVLAEGRYLCMGAARGWLDLDTGAIMQQLPGTPVSLWTLNLSQLLLLQDTPHAPLDPVAE